MSCLYYPVKNYSGTMIPMPMVDGTETWKCKYDLVKRRADIVQKMAMLNVATMPRKLAVMQMVSTLEASSVTSLNECATRIHFIPRVAMLLTADVKVLRAPIMIMMNSMQFI